MNQFPVVTIVGRQNVGKSTLYNALVGKQIAITKDEPGVTRDVLKNLVSRDLFVKEFYLCDTPGLDIESINDLTTSILEISFEHLAESDIIIFLLDKNSTTPYDDKLLALILKDEKFRNKSIIYCVNKADSPEDEYELDLYYQKGLKEIIPVSAKGRRNIPLLIEKINFYLKDLQVGEKSDVEFSIAIIGKPNAGKSSLLNALLGYERSVVSEIAGTTRDPNSSYLEYNGKILEIYDTAGIRKKSDKSEDIEYYSYTRAIQTIEKCDLMIIVIDALKGIGEFDKKIFALVQNNGKPAVLAVNKWDLVEDKDSNSFTEYKKNLVSRFPPAAFMPVVSISAMSKQRIHKLIDECILLHERIQLKILTSELNRQMKIWSRSAIFNQGKRHPKILYATQVSNVPFKIIIFVNDMDAFKPNIVAFIKNSFINHYELNGVQVDIELRSHREKKYAARI